MEKQFDGRTRRFVASRIKEIIDALAADPKREGLAETPNRAAKMLLEMLQGEQWTNEEIARMFTKCFEVKTNDLVVVSNIPVFSMCEHHLALMYNMHISVGYLPKDGKVLGLSKVARIAEMVCHRMQVQERIGEDIADIMHMATDSDDIIVVIEAEHGCMTARGIKKPGTLTRTATLRGKFRQFPELRMEFYELVKKA